MKLAAAALCLLFVLAASLWIDKPGIQADEALFTMGNFYPEGVAYKMWFFGHRIPLMQMSYLGSLKAWLYAPVFALAEPSALTLRLPVILLGALTLWLLYRFLAEAASPRAALIAVALLCLEPTFLWTTRCDWGPVAIQHFLVVAGAYAAYRRRIVLAAFLFGLALWDKTVAVWILSGLALSALVLYRHAVRKALRPRLAVLALLALLAGAYPLIRYNVVTTGQTAQHTARFSLTDFDIKVTQLKLALRGDALIGYLIPDDEGVGFRATFLPYLLLLCVPLLVKARSRLALFCLLSSTVAWAFMAITHGGGISAHHVVLLWPWPHAFAALTLAAAIPSRAVLAAITAVATLSCAAVNWHDYSMLHLRGTYPPWSDAIYPLARYLNDTRPPQVFVNDWGILDQVRLLSAGRLSVANSLDLPPERYVSRGEAVFVEHTDEWESIKGASQRLRAVPGYQVETLRLITDSKQRPIFRVYRFIPR
ncbi:MAG: glycosyltransferase family 39 protein [Bryobacterales bacterium]|nr:glycosyltransferase family 39 protein [Bryobacterales bacterium]